jgi:eukaryotic-like serine/threonine-protein kinase
LLRRTDTHSTADAAVAETEAAHGTLSDPGAPVAPREPAPPPYGYEIVGQLGQGGMGRVVRARDVELGREVAIKELLSGGDEARRRFRREARITARLQHPAIVPVYEVATTPGGDPYYAMKLVEGETLSARIARAASLNERLALLRHVVVVAEAVAYAHSHRVIHRDLKASNVVIGAFGETIVIDWGLAKDVADADDVAPDAGPFRGPPGDLTEQGAVMGTPAYMPPEQAEGDAVDERADVYAIGAMLYHLLAGTTPYEGRTSREVLARVLEGPPRPLAERVPDVPRDLAAIVGKAMAREPAGRYPSARELAAELERFETGQLVGVHEYSTRELVARWMRRHRAAVVVGAIAVILAVTEGAMAISGIVAARDRESVARREAERGRDEAEAARADAVRKADEAILAVARDLADDDPRASLERLRELSPGSRQWSAARMVAADAMAHGVRTPVGQLGGAAWGGAMAPDGTFYAVSTTQLLRARHDTKAIVQDAKAAAVAEDGTAVGWIEGSEAVIEAGGATRRVEAPADVHWLAIAPGGAQITVHAGEEIVQVDVATGASRVLGPAPGGDMPTVVAYTGGGRYVSARRFVPPSLELWLADGTPVAAPPEASSVAASLDGRWLAFYTEQGFVLRGPRGVEKTIAPPLGQFAGVTLEFDPTSRWLLWTQIAGIDDGVVHAYDVPHSQLHRLDGHTRGSTAITFTHDGTRAITAANDGAVRFWDLERLARDGKPYATAEPSGVQPWLQADEVVMVLGLDEARGEVLTMTGSGVVERWPAPLVPRRLLDGESVRSPDGEWLARQTRDGRITLERLRGGVSETRSLEGIPTHEHSRRPRPLPSFAAAAPVIAVSDGEDVIRWDHERNTTKRVDMLAQVVATAISADGDTIAIGDIDGGVSVWDASDTVEQLVDADGGYPLITRDGSLVVAGNHRRVRLFRVADHHELQIPASKTAALSPDGHRLALAGSGTVQSCTLPDLACTLLADGASAERLWIRDDGRVVAQLADHSLATWDDARASRRIIGHHRDSVPDLAFSPDGRTIITAGSGPEVHLWDLASGEGRILRTQMAQPTDVWFGDGVVEVTDWSAVHTFRDDLPHDEAALRNAIDAALGV